MIIAKFYIPTCTAEIFRVCIRMCVRMLGPGIERESHISHPKENTDSEKDVARYVLVRDHTQTA